MSDLGFEPMSVYLLTLGSYLFIKKKWDEYILTKHPDTRALDSFCLAMHMNITVNIYHRFRVEIVPNSLVIFITKDIYLYQINTKYSNSLHRLVIQKVS